MESKYQKIIRVLKNEIFSGKYKIDSKLPTEAEMTKEFNVSRDTVRRAVGQLENENVIYRIQGAGMFVEDWHKKRITNNREIIGVITTHIADYIFPKIISGIDHIVSNYGYSLVISNTHNNHKKEHESLINMLELHVSGLIIEPTQSALPNPNLELYQEIISDEIPAIFINAKYPGVKFPSLTTDDEQGEKILIQHLFDLGHERILGIFQVDDIQGVHRMNGFVKACQDHLDISYKSNIIMYKSDDDLKKLFEQVKGFLDLKHNRPSAIACYNDELAIKLINFLKKSGYSVPNDLAVAGFDNYEMAPYISPSLTTVTHEQENMGKKAGQMICDLINKKPVSSVMFEPELIVRDSTRKIKNHPF
ncbi:GntR family transcriptional regulator [Liquorilactobacillus vini]|nr:GntR family transcriptional regulator [Liquorilactobacillus vini]